MSHEVFDHSFAQTHLFHLADCQVFDVLHQKFIVPHFVGVFQNFRSSCPLHLLSVVHVFRLWVEGVLSFHDPILVVHFLQLLVLFHFFLKRWNIFCLGQQVDILDGLLVQRGGTFDEILNNLNQLVQKHIILGCL